MEAAPMRGRPIVAISAGEPAGIGPELIALLDRHHREHRSRLARRRRRP
jgi:4-hydroxy-L-threonine phosphate dehydrogenase PdxA